MFSRKRVLVAKHIRDIMYENPVEGGTLVPPMPTPWQYFTGNINSTVKIKIEIKTKFSLSIQLCRIGE